MTVELAVGLAGLFLAACAFVVFFVDKVTKKETEIHLIKDHMGRILRKVDELQARETELLNRANDLAQAHHSRPDLAVFVSKQWEFVEKTFHNRFEKHRICRRIVINHLSSNTNVLLDSGSTVDLITFELLTSNKENIKHPIE